MQVFWRILCILFFASLLSAGIKGLVKPYACISTANEYHISQLEYADLPTQPKMILAGVSILQIILGIGCFLKLPRKKDKLIFTILSIVFVSFWLMTS